MKCMLSFFRKPKLNFCFINESRYFTSHKTFGFHFFCFFVGSSWDSNPESPASRCVSLTPLDLIILEGKAVQENHGYKKKHINFEPFNFFVTPNQRNVNKTCIIFSTNNRIFNQLHCFFLL